jgi:hypothetical protein
VAVQSDNTIGHWRICFGSVTKVGTVPGATTSDPVGLGLESVAASGKPLKMGLAYREKTTGLLKYARWSASTGWSTPVGVRSLSILGGPAMTKGGPVAFVYTNSRAYVTFYDPTTDTFSSLSRPPVDPTTVADPTKRLSVGFDPAFGGITFLGWRMANGNFVQSTGSLSCSTYFCASDPAYPNSWTSAMLAYGPGQRLSIATTHTVSGVNVFENRVISGGTNYGWGGNQRIDYGIQPGVAQIGDDIMVVDSNTSGLFVSRSDDCFANDF